jgi:dihydroflavonol-4-reductase
VSSLAALDRRRRPITETGWNLERSNVYFRSKTDSEQLAWELAARLGLDMVAVLPGAMIGPHDGASTPTLSLFATILQGRLAADPGFYFNFVDVRDVASGCLRAAERGRAGERYLLANEHCTRLHEIVQIAQALVPEKRIRTPLHPPRPMVAALATIQELVARMRGRAPELQRNFLRNFSIREECDISKAQRELDFDPRPPHEAIAATLRAMAAADRVAG